MIESIHKNIVNECGRIVIYKVYQSLGRTNNIVKTTENYGSNRKFQI